MEGIRIGLQGEGSAVVDAYGVVHPDGWRAESCGWWLAASDKWLMVPLLIWLSGYAAACWYFVPKLGD